MLLFKEGGPARCPLFHLSCYVSMFSRTGYKFKHVFQFILDVFVYFIPKRLWAGAYLGSIKGALYPSLSFLFPSSLSLLPLSSPPSTPFPSPSLKSTLSLIQVRRLEERCKLPSGSWRSPAAKRYLAHFEELKMLLVRAIISIYLRKFKQNSQVY